MFKKIILSLFIIGILLAVGIYYYVFVYAVHNKRQVSDQVAILITADSLTANFTSNETLANATYLNKVIQVSGVVIETGVNQEGKTTVTLGTEGAFSNVFVTFKNKETLKKGDVVVVKGFCNGFFSDVVLVDGIVVK